MFNDSMNNNLRLYRDKAHLRSDESPENQKLFKSAVQPFTECNDHNQNKYRAEQNIVQKRFPMLREYERAKVSQIQSSQHDEYSNVNSGYKSHRKGNNSSTNEYFQINKPTFNQQVRQKLLIRTDNGLPLSKVRPPSIFIPNNPSQAKTMIKNDNSGLFQEEFDLKRKKDFEDHERHKRKMVAGVFRQSYYNDNYGKSMSQSRLRKSNDSFIGQSNNFRTFLQEKQELPRLSILQNYTQIMRIMTQNYIKSVEYDQKYKNRDQTDILGDDDYVKFKEEEVNTKKMSTILKSLNSPRRKTAQSFNARMSQYGKVGNNSKTDRSGTGGRNVMSSSMYSQGFSTAGARIQQIINQ
eukprot:403348668